MEDRVLGQIQNNTRHKMGMYFERQLQDASHVIFPGFLYLVFFNKIAHTKPQQEYIYIYNFPVQNSKIKLCTGIFNLKIVQNRLKFSVPILWCPKMRARVEK